MITLQVTVDGRKKTFSFSKEPKIIIGRSPDCQIPIDDKKASRHHCVIERTPIGYNVIDMKSVNGTFINGVRLPNAPLAVGDEVKIGDLAIKVTAINLPADAHAATETARDRVKSKIDEKKNVMRQVKTYAAVKEVTDTVNYYKTVFYIVGGVAAILLLLFFLPSLTPKPPEQQTPTAPKDFAAIVNAETDEERESARLLEQLDKEILSVPTITRAHIDRSREIARQVSDLLMKVLADLRAQGVPEKQIAPKAEMLHNRYEDIANSKSTEVAGRYYADIDQKRDKTMAAAKDLLKNNNYAAAIAALRSFSDSVDDPVAKDDAATMIDTIQKQAAADYAMIKAHFDRMLKDKRYEEAAKYLIAQQPRFRDTNYFATIYAMASNWKQLADNDKAQPPAKEEVVRKEIAAKEKSLKPLVDEATSLLNAGRPLEAETAFKKLLEAAKDQPELARQYKDKHDELQRYNALSRKLMTEINAGKLAAAKIRVGAQEGTPTKASESGITFKADSRESLTAWKDIPPKAVADMLVALGPADEELYTLAVYCEINKLIPQAYDAIFKYMQNDASGERKQKGETFVARTKGTSVPDGGYLYVPSKKDFVSRREKKEGDALADAQKTATAMAKITSATAFEKSFEKVFAVYTDGEISSEGRQKVHDMLLTAVKLNKDEQLKSLKSRAGGGAKLSQLRDLKVKLNKARQEALAIIFDRSIYPDADHGRIGQPKVDAAVKKAEDIWKDAGKVIVSNNPELLNSITTIQKINGEFLKRLGENASGDDLKDMEEVINNIGRDINLSTFALDAKERETIEYNQVVEKYNAKLAGVSDALREHVRVVNDYRDMMGMKKLFIEKRLNAASQKHTETMQAAGNIWHVGSDGDPNSRAKAAGFSGYTGENVLMGSTTPEQAFKQWYNSSGHHRNMLGKHNTMGVGIAGRYWTQMFGVTKTPW